MADTSGAGARGQMSGWAMPVITLALAGVALAVGWGVAQRDREELSRRLERLEGAKTSERLAVIETKLDLIVSGLGLQVPPSPSPRVQR